MFKTNEFLRSAATLAVLLCAAAFSTSPHAATYSPAYPHGCFSNGLQVGKSSIDPHAVTSPLVYFSYNTTLGSSLSETGGTVTVYRVPCNGGQAATVIEFDRSSTFNGSTTQYPDFPSVYITTTSGSTTTSIAPRIAQEPYTQWENIAAGTAFYSDMAVVLEYYDPSNSLSATSIDYRQAFALNINNLAGGGLPLVLNIPAYTAPTSPALEINGYVSTNFYDPAHSGEGMIVQVYDGTGTTRTFSAAWYTFDPLGLPFWLIAQGSINIGDTAANNVPTYYLTGGGFAGDFGASAPTQQWGTTSFTFPDCNTMNFSYSGATDTQTNGPQGSGSRVWKRVASVNGLACN